MNGHVRRIFNLEDLVEHIDQYSEDQSESASTIELVRLLPKK